MNDEDFKRAIEVIISERLICPNCRLKFGPVYPNQKYCSSGCMVSFNRGIKRSVYICVICNKKFPGGSKRVRKTCSDKCRVVYIQGRRRRRRSKG